MNIIEIDMFSGKNRNIAIFLIVILLSVIISFIAFSGCSLNRMVGSTYNNDPSLTLRDIDIDEKEVESIKTMDDGMEKSYDISSDISSIADELDNPFKPFYAEEETDEVKNILILQDILFEDGIETCKIKFNDYTYILYESDTFFDIYMVQSINESSVVILKGDELFTLYIGEMVHD
jgi:hypothetical protein